MTLTLALLTLHTLECPSGAVRCALIIEAAGGAGAGQLGLAGAGLVRAPGTAERRRDVAEDGSAHPRGD